MLLSEQNLEFDKLQLKKNIFSSTSESDGNHGYSSKERVEWQ